MKNHALHIVLLTKDREFQNFKDKQCDDQENNFKEAKSSLKSDLTYSCNIRWNPIKHPWNKY